MCLFLTVQKNLSLDALNGHTSLVQSDWSLPTMPIFVTFISRLIEAKMV